MTNEARLTVMNVGYAYTNHEWGGQDISSPFARLYYVKHGRARLIMPDRAVEATPGHMYLIPAFVPHRYECDPGIGFYYIFLLEHNRGVRKILEHSRFPFEVNAGPEVDELFTHYAALYPGLSLPYQTADLFERHPAFSDYAQAYAQLAPYEKMQLQGLALILLSYFAKHAEPRPELLDGRVERVVHYIGMHLTEPLSTERLANVACVTRVHLTRLFRQRMHTSLQQYIIAMRIEQSQRLLMTTAETVAEVAQRVGFRDTSYFIRLFRRHIGLTPQRYRDTLR